MRVIFQNNPHQSATTARVDMDEGEPMELVSALFKASDAPPARKQMVMDSLFLCDSVAQLKNYALPMLASIKDVAEDMGDMYFVWAVEILIQRTVFTIQKYYENKTSRG